MRTTFHVILPLLMSAGLTAGELKFRHAVDREFTEEGAALAKGTIEEIASGSTHTSAWASCEFPFNEVLVSWNVDVPVGGGFAVELRFGREPEGAIASAWYHLGRFGSHPAVEKPVTEDDGGKVDVDCFHAKGFYRSVQYRLRLLNPSPGAAVASVEGKTRLRRMTVLVSNSPGNPELSAKFGRAKSPLREAKPIRLEVPFRSQKAEDASIRGRICSPTSVTMLLAYRGTDCTTTEVAARAFDKDHDIYGNWPANIQAAYSLGAPGRIARFRSWDAARERVAAGQPIVISIRDKLGALKGAPYPKTDGHLLVLTGFDAYGNVCVNDPAAVDAAQGVAVYDREQMEEVWLNQGGVAYLIEPRATP